MDQVIQFALMLLVIILGIYAFGKLALNRRKKLQTEVGVVTSKIFSNADEFSASKGYVSTKERYSVKIKCGEDEKIFKLSESMYDLLEVNQKISFEYSGGVLFNFKEL